MTMLQRLKEVAIGLSMIVVAIIMLISPNDGYELIISILTFWFVVKGISDLINYFTMSRFMVGGRMSLYMGILMLDFGLFTDAMTDIPHFYLMIYLVALHAFSGLVEVLRALEARRNGSSSYRLKLSHGALDLLMALCCIIFIRHLGIAVLIYSIGLIYSSVLRIISACRRTRLVYIQ